MPPAASLPPPEVIEALGRVPDFWRDRGVIFVANLMAMFFGNEEETGLLRREIAGADTYGGRLLPLIGLLFGGQANRLVLERQPDPLLGEYFARELGLRLPEVDVLSHADYLALGRALETGGGWPCEAMIRSWADAPAAFMDGFVTDGIIAGLARCLGKLTIASAAGSRRGNNKLLLHQHLERAGLPVFETRLAAAPAEVADCLRHLAARGYDHAVVKSQIGASGIGLVKLPTTATGAAVPALFFHEGPCLVQGWLRPGSHGVTRVMSPSVQLFLTDARVMLYDLTEQLLSGDSVHQGNESPPGYLAEFPGLERELLDQAAVAGVWLHQQGYRGTASVDFLVVALSGGGFRVHACEINARVTGATYPAVLARHHLPSGAWLMRNLRLSAPLPSGVILDCLRRHGGLFRPGDEEGILPVNFNLAQDGLVTKGQFLFLGQDAGACRRLLNRAGGGLPLAWEFVRD